MSLSNKSAEMQRLIEAFEIEAGKFHDIQFHTFHITQEQTTFDRKFAPQNHTIMLWQYYGAIKGDGDIEGFVTNLQDSELQWGLRGSALSLLGVIEGEACQLFVRMATRAGSLFSEEEARHIKSHIISEILDAEKSKDPSAKPMTVTNDHPLSIWLNFLLYHLSMVNPGRERANKIDPDPFSLSLVALERLVVDQAIGKVDRSTCKLADLHFKVAMSFPGEKRRYVSRVVDALRGPLGKDAVFYDYDYQGQLARPNLDTLLQRIYRDQSDLIVVFLCAEYAAKQWPGLEWRAVRDIIKSKEDHRVMFVRFDDASIDGVFSIDGFIDGGANTARQVAEFIVTRIGEFEHDD
ncbi:MAG: disease resistance protein [Planctomycetota bacterium]